MHGILSALSEKTPQRPISNYSTLGLSSGLMRSTISCLVDHHMEVEFKDFKCYCYLTSQGNLVFDRDYATSG